VESPPPLPVGKVFVPGGLPTVTYNPRSELKLEQRVRDYLDERHRILSVSGPTKTGKTVLLRSILRDAIWLSGGSITSAEDFWTTVADKLCLYTEVVSERSSEEADKREWSGEARLKIPFAEGKGGRTAGSSTTAGASRRLGRSRPASAVVREALDGSLYSLVIDDFHYVLPEVQLQLVRGLKDLVFDGLAVVVAAVPHRAYDVMRVEKEMTGRVEQLEVGFWSPNDLQDIARHGFRGLNVIDTDERLGARLATESFSSPHLMQEFCLDLCKRNEIRTQQEVRRELKPPEDWGSFFRSRASSASKTAFDLLTRGPRQRSDRIVRRLKNGKNSDIYGAVLAAIAETGPLTDLTYEQLRGSLRDVLSSDVPQRHEVTRVLEEMAKIAKEQIEGEPVVDFDADLGKLFISDPYFAYYLRWGEEAASQPATGSPAGR